MGTILFIFQTKNLQNQIHLDCINSFLVTEDYTSIFSREELSTILQVCLFFVFFFGFLSFCYLNMRNLQKVKYIHLLI